MKSNMRQKPYKLLPDFEWSDIDVSSSVQLDELYSLLHNHYVEDMDEIFRLDYSRDFLRWALTPPNYLPELHIGVRVRKTNKLCAFISAIPVHVRVYNQSYPMAEVNFLCIHKKLRGARLTPLLIKEIKRRANLSGISKALYTSGSILSEKPISQCQYFHRFLNVRKLIDVGFTDIPHNSTIMKIINTYQVPSKIMTRGLRPMLDKDISSIHNLLQDHLDQFKLVMCFDTEEEVRHWLLPRKGIIQSFVVESDSGEITDFISFYHLPSTIIGHPRYSVLNTAYSFYSVANKTPYEQLLNDMLVLGAKDNFDVFNALNLLDNKVQILENLKFCPGDGGLNFYIHNHIDSKPISTSDVGVLLF